MRIYVPNAITGADIISDQTTDNFNASSSIHPFFRKVAVFQSGGVVSFSGSFGTGVIISARGSIKVDITSSGTDSDTQTFSEDSPVLYQKTATITNITLTAQSGTPLLFSCYSATPLTVPQHLANRTLGGQFGGSFKVSQGFQVASTAGEVASTYNFSIGLTPAEYEAARGQVKASVGKVGWFDLYNDGTSMIYGYVPATPTTQKTDNFYSVNFVVQEAL